MKWIVRGLGALVLMVVIAVGLLFLLPSERIARVATDQIRAATGREVSLNGDVSITLWPVLGISAERLEVANAPWSDLGPMLSTDGVSIGVDAAALLAGNIRVTHVEAVSPTIRLEQRADGNASWTFGEATAATGQAPTDATAGAQTASPAFGMDRLSLENATLLYVAEGSETLRFDGVDVTLDWPDPGGAATITATLRSGGQPVEVSATIGAFAGFIAGQVQPISAQVSAAGGALRFDGRGNTGGDLAGQVSVKLPNTDAFVRALGAAAFGLPQGLGASIDAESKVTLTADQRLSLRELTADLGGNSLNGAADITLGDVPKINAQIETSALDLSDLASGETGGAAPIGSASAPGTGDASAGWPKTEIDASGLAAFNGEIALRAPSVTLDTLKLGPTRVLLRNERSRMVFELREVQAYGGNVTGEFVMNNRNGLSVGGKIAARNVGLQALLRDAVDVDDLTGQGNADLSFLGVGETVDTIMRSLSGNGSISVGRGTIEGIDLDRLMSSGDGSGGTTIFDSLGATFAMEDGNMQNQDLLLSLSSFEARGAGRVGLGSRDIDYVFTPAALKLNEGKGLAIPIRIRGPWAQPRVRPDLEAALDLNLEAEKDRLREEAKAKAEAKIAEEVGVSLQEGQDLEDAVKDKVDGEIDKLEDKLKKGLQSLFD